jgi:organic hydroperoxide reductase OsmC/OhrA
VKRRTRCCQFVKTVLLWNCKQELGSGLHYDGNMVVTASAQQSAGLAVSVLVVLVEETMRPLPHLYSVTSMAVPNAHVRINSLGLSELSSEPPAEFGGPGDLWSPETLMMAAVADCFTLTFRAAAKITNLPWTRLECVAEGTVDRVDGATRFTTIHLRVSLSIPLPGDTERARRLLEKTEKGCLVANSLKAQRTLEYAVEADAAKELKIA